MSSAAACPQPPAGWPSYRKLSLAGAICLLPLIVGVSFAALPLSANAEGAPDEAQLQTRIADLIEQMGSPSFTDRERATDQLRELGLVTKEQLLTAVDHPDAEISFRARRLLVIVLAEDFDARVAAFAADEQGELDHDLPAWDEFQQVVGSDPASRALFVEMLRSEPLLLENYSGDVTKLKQTLVARCDQMYEEMKNRRTINNHRINAKFSLGSIASLYFSAAHPDVTVDNNLANRMNQLMHRSPLREDISSGDKVRPLKRLLGAWIVASANSSMAYQNVWLALQYDIEEGLEPARHLIRTNRAGSSILPTAILAVAKLGGESERDTLEELLEKDQTVRTYSRNGKKLTCKTRDVALVALLHLEEQDPKDFGFEHVQPYPRTLYQVGTIGFENDEKRKAAFDKWDEYLAEKAEKQQKAEEKNEESKS